MAATHQHGGELDPNEETSTLADEMRASGFASWCRPPGGVKLENGIYVPADPVEYKAWIDAVKGGK